VDAGLGAGGVEVCLLHQVLALAQKGRVRLGPMSLSLVFPPP